MQTFCRASHISMHVIINFVVHADKYIAHFISTMHVQFCVYNGLLIATTVTVHTCMYLYMYVSSLLLYYRSIINN